jgi:hypothetical protein
MMLSLCMTKGFESDFHVGIKIIVRILADYNRHLHQGNLR